MANLELTPQEFVRIVQALKATPDKALIMNDNDQLTFFEKDKHTRSLVDKLAQISEEDPEISTYIESRFDD